MFVGDTAISIHSDATFSEPDKVGIDVADIDSDTKANPPPSLLSATPTR